MRLLIRDFHTKWCMCHKNFFHCVIGPRGSEIKHIRGNYKVDVYIPSSDSVTENVVCVGRPKDVEKAIAYIKLLMERD